MKTYTDGDIRANLKAWIDNYTYRGAAELIGVDVGYLHRIVNGKRPVCANVAYYMGFEPVPKPAQVWRRLRFTRKTKPAA